MWPAAPRTSPLARAGSSGGRGPAPPPARGGPALAPPPAVPVFRIDIAAVTWWLWETGSQEVVMNSTRSIWNVALGKKSNRRTNNPTAMTVVNWRRRLPTLIGVPLLVGRSTGGDR